MPSEPERQDESASVSERSCAVVELRLHAGGFDEIAALVARAEPGRGIAYLVTQCAGAGDEPNLIDRLAQVGRLSVQRASEGEALRSDHVYVAEAERAFEVCDGFLRAAPSPARARRTSERLQRQSTLLRIIYDTAAVGLGVIDRECRFVGYNGVMAMMAEVPAGAGVEDELPPMERPAVPPGMATVARRVLDSGETECNVEIIGAVRRSDGIESSWLCGFAPVFGDRGQVEAVTAVVRDITDRKRTLAALEAADRHKDEFLAMLGHELRNPLAAIRNAIDLQKLSLGDEARMVRARDVIDRQAAHMARLVDGLLDVSRIARGKIRIERRAVSLRALIDMVLSDARETLGQKGLDLSYDVFDDDLWVMGDATRLAQIIDNLLANAVKFTDAPGAVSVRAWIDDGDAVLEVSDTGVGMEPELLSRAFEPFSQASQSIDRAAGGLGLGLALVKLVVDLHGGSVHAASCGRGQGATFTLRLPMAQPPIDRPAAAPAAVGGEPVRILVVDDNHDLVEALGDVLEIAGHDVAVAYTGQQALEVARSFGPDVVLCDIGLPGELNGYDVARALRKDAAHGEAVLIALTGYGRSEDRARAKEAGFDDHLTKPVEVDRIEAVLMSLGVGRP